MLEREWVTVTDPADDHRRYTFDVSFLLSGYRCIYGAGCEGIHPGEQDPAIGCCVHGAYLNEDDDADEIGRIVREELGPDTMQFHDVALSDGFLEVDEDGETRTRVVDGGCIFANRSGHPVGEGCVLHHLALRGGRSLIEYKPTVCWQVPLHRTVEEQVANDGETLEVHTIAAFERGHWGEGGAAFDWWCLDDATAFVSPEPLYLSMEEELRQMVGDLVYEELAGYLDERRGASGVVSFLPVVAAGND